MIDPKRLARLFLDEWQDTEQPIQQRGTILPLGIYEDGSAHLAVPGLINDGIEGWNALWDDAQAAREGTYPTFDEEQGKRSAGNSLMAAGLAATGGLAAGAAGGLPDNALASNAMRARPEPSPLNPKAGAMGASDVLAEGDTYGTMLRTFQGALDEGELGPFFGMANPGALTGDALRQVAKTAFDKELARNGWDNNFEGIAADAPHPAIASALWDAAQATGRTLDIVGDEKHPFASAYGRLRTPAGGSYKVRVADHSQTSPLHDSPEFNIAPGAMTPEEFIDLLPTIYSNPKTSALAPMALSEDGSDDDFLSALLSRYGVSN